MKGKLGVNNNIYELIHITSINTLVDLNANLKKEISKIESLDEWSMTDYQQRKLQELKQSQELVNLLIGYKKFQEQQASAKTARAEMRAELKALKESAMSPQDRINALEAKLAEEEDDFSAEGIEAPILLETPDTPNQEPSTPETTI